MNKLLNITIGALIVAPLYLQADMDRCVSCHGVDFEKSALGVSKIVKNMSEEEIKAALDGYKKGVGGPMKALMIQEVNLGVDTDAMAADIYNEIHTPGFEEPADEFVFQKRLSVKTLHKIKANLEKATKDDMPKISSQIKSAAFTMYTYDKLLQSKVNFSDFEAKKLSKEDIQNSVSKIKKCVDHSFTDEDMVKCRIDFMTLAGNLVKNEELKIKAKSKAAKKPIFTGEMAVDLSEYIK